MKTYERRENLRRKTEYILYHDLPLIDLEGKNKQLIGREIINLIPECLSKIPYLEDIKMGEHCNPDKCYFDAVFADGDRNYNITVTFYSLRCWVESCLTYREIPSNKLSDIFELINVLNDGITLGTFRVLLDRNAIVIETGMYVTRYFNSQELVIQLRQMIARATIHFPFIDEMIDTDHDACSIIRRAAEDWQGFLINGGVI